MAPNSCVLAPVMHVVPFTPWISVCPPYAVLTETRFSPRRTECPQCECLADAHVLLCRFVDCLPEGAPWVLKCTCATVRSGAPS